MNELDGSLSDFVSSYDEEMKNLVRELEPERKKYHLVFCRNTKLSLFLNLSRWLVLFCALYFSIMNNGYALLSFLLVLIMSSCKGLCDAKIAATKLDYKKNIKKVFFSKLFERLDGFKYEYADKEKMLYLSDELQKLNIFGSFTNLYCDDCLYFNDYKINLEIYDLALQTKINKYVISNFEGVLVVAPSFKSFEGTTVIKPKSNVKAFSDVMTSLERVNFEDPVFEDIFDVYSTNQIDARYLITTAFIERLINFVKDKNRSIICSFEEDMVYLGIKDSKDWFELPIDKSLKDVQNISSLFDELNLITELVTTLKLENKIGF